MKKETVAYILRLTVVLFLITAVVAGLLGLVNYVTKDKIAQINQEKTSAAMNAVLPADSYTPVEQLPVDAPETVAAAYTASTGGSLTGYVVEVKPTGFGGEIDIMVGVDTAGAVTGISIVSHSETASLGAVAAENNAKGESFRQQFVGSSGTLAVSKDGGTIDALTGATVTSRAVTGGVNDALACAAQMTEG